MEPLTKRSRSEFDGPGYGEPPQPAQQQQQEWCPAIQQGGGGGGDAECRHFNTPEGCPYGSSCRFRHVPNDGRDPGQPGLSFGGKPKPCMKFFSTSGCPFGESCHFLHYVPGGLSSLGLAPVVSFTAASASQRKPAGPSGDPTVTVSGYKTKLCNRFNTAEGCRFGDRCHFAHGEQELRLPHNMPRGTTDVSATYQAGPASENVQVY
uniref:Zinc finger CCCH domain-containing protein 14 n=1 Tax=Anthurium amnicola TaxID=1678845 RepID=A0A1D1ZJP2_9ARAE